MSVDPDKVKALREALVEGADDGTVATAKKNLGCGTIGCLGVIAVLVLLGVVGALVPTDDDASKDKAKPAAAAPPTPKSAWRHDAQVDRMTDAVTRTACVRAQETIEAPDGRKLALDLCLRNGADGARTAFLAVEAPGRLNCPKAGCQARMRFDKAPAQTFVMARARNGAPTQALIADRAGLEAGLAEAETTLIQLAADGDGEGPIFTFETWGLDWPDDDAEAPAAKAEAPAAKAEAAKPSPEKP